MKGIDSLDTDVLTEYLKSRIDDFPATISATKFEGGQSNPTFMLADSASASDNIADPARKFVLRKQPPGKLLKSAHAVDREFKVMSALATSDVPVPRMYCLCEDREIIGEMFFVMEYLEGSTYWDASLPDLDPASRRVVYEEMAQALASIATLDYTAAGLADFGRPGNYFERQLSRWSQQYRLSEFTTIDSMEWIMAWLKENMPADDGRTSLVHGDFRLDNLKYSSTDKNGVGTAAPKLIGVLDWELSTLGHPMADLANLCMQSRIPPGMANMSGLAGKDVTELGIPDEQEILAQYSSRTGIPISHWPFYLSFGLFRIAAILQGVARRASDGNASNPMGAKLGEFVEPLADIAVQVVKSENND